MTEVVAGPLTARPPAISGDGKWIYACCGSEVFKFNTRTSRIASVLAGHSSTVSGVATLTDGSLLSASMDGSLKLWRDQRCVRTIEMGSSVLDVRVSPLSGASAVVACLLATGIESSLVTFRLVDGCSISERETLFTGIISSFDVSPTFAACTSGSRLFVYSFGREAGRELRHKRPLTACTLDAAHVATGDCHGSITRWCILDDAFWEGGSEAFIGTSQHWHSAAVASLRVAGHALLSGGDEAVLCLWHGVDARKPQFLPRLGGPIVHIAVSGPSDAPKLAAVSLATNCIVLVDLHRTTVCGVVTGFPTGLKTFSLAPWGDQLLVSRSGASVHAFSTKDRRQLGPGVAVGERNFVGIAWSKITRPSPWLCSRIAASEKVLATAMTRDGEKASLIKFWNITGSLSGRLASVCMRAHDAEITGLTATTDGFASCSSDGSLKLWRLEDRCWRVSRVIRFRDQPATALTTQNGVLACGFGNFITLFDVTTGKELTGGIFVGDKAKTLAITGTRLAALTEHTVVAVELKTCNIVSRMIVKDTKDIVSYCNGFALCCSDDIRVLDVDLNHKESTPCSADALALVNGDLLAVSGESLLRIGAHDSDVSIEDLEEELEHETETKVIKQGVVERETKAPTLAFGRIVAEVLDPLQPSHICPSPARLFAKLAQRVAAQ